MRMVVLVLIVALCVGCASVPLTAEERAQQMAIGMTLLGYGTQLQTLNYQINSWEQYQQQMLMLQMQELNTLNQYNRYGGKYVR